MDVLEWYKIAIADAVKTSDNLEVLEIIYSLLSR